MLRRRHFPLSPAARVNAGDAFFGVLAAMGICVLANFVASYILAYLSQFGIEAPASPELLVHTPESLLYNILVIAVLPALLEEMVFRGYLLRRCAPMAIGLRWASQPCALALCMPISRRSRLL